MQMINLLHSISIIVAATIGYLFGYTNLGAMLMMAFFVGRELTQAEYKWIQRYGLGKRRNMPWWGALDYRVWDVHSFWWNTTLPLLITIAFVIY